MGAFFRLLKSGTFITVLGLALLALLIWFGGPYLGLGDHQPLASPVVRLLAIVVIVAAWAIWLQLQHLRARSKAGRMSGEMADPGAAPSAADADERGAAERAQLQARFQEAVATLRKRRGGGNLYTLPWYVVIGPPGSGKTTLLQNSGLHFPLAGTYGAQALRGVGGTRNCDWWFTDEAVFLDTAGRYTTQDSDRSADAGAWAAFLDLLRRYRKRRPINGVLVAMSLSDLLLLDEAGRQEHTQAIRHRLDELAEHLRIGMPVYLVLTKADLVAGFGEFFDDLNPELRNQVWGMSFAVAQTIDGSAAGTFADEFQLLLDRVQARVLDRLHAERDHVRRGAILSFPQQLAALREIARSFVEGVFGARGHAQAPLLRGVYLTSGTQEGAPIDRMMAAVARTFGVDASRVAAPGAQKRTFFVERLLRGVIFPESGFAGTNPKLERQKVALQAAAYVGVVLAAGLLFAAFATSYGRNRAYLAKVENALRGFPVNADFSAATTQKAYFALALQRLEALSDVRDAARQASVPWLMRFGLYQGSAIGSEVDNAYLRELNALLLPGVASQFRIGLTGHAADPQALYYYLKGYLMLGKPEHAVPEELAALTNIEWRKVFPGDPVLQAAMARHFQALVDKPERLHPIALDDGLVEQARATLRTADLSALVYGSMKLAMDDDAHPPLRLDKALGLLGNVFRRNSGQGLSEPIPALYTQPVFAQAAGGGADKAASRFAQDDWVFGGGRMDAVRKAHLVQQVMGLYEQDYIKAWDGLLADLKLQPATSIQDASAIAAKLSGPSSPLKALLVTVRDNTHDMLRAPPESSGDKALDAVKNAAGKKATQTALGRALAKAAGDPSEAAQAQPGQAISEHFAVLDQLTDGPPGAAPIDHALSVLDQLSKTLLTMTDFSGGAGQPNPQLLTAQQEAAQLPPPVSGWVASLTGSSASMVASGTKGALDDQFQQAVAKDCADFTQGRYPFAPNGKSEIPLQNFGELFGYGGRFDGFYKQSLEKLIDAGARTWRWKSGPGAVTGSPGMLAQMQQADAIKQMYFRTGSTAPEVSFTLLAPQLDPAIGKLSINIDGQKWDYQPGGAGGPPMKWPGPTPGQVSIAAYDSAGTLISQFDYQGDWALFRALQAAHLQKQSDLRFLATFDFGGKQAKVVVQAANLKNPFLNAQVQRFRCGG